MEIEELNKNLEKLNELTERQISFKFIILKGTVYGFSTAIGATIIAGVILSFLSGTLDTAEKMEVLESIQREQ